MAREAGDCPDQSSGLRRMPEVSPGIGSPVGMPKPKSRNISYCWRRERRLAILATPTLDDTRSASARVSVLALGCTSFSTRPATYQLPLPMSTRSSSVPTSLDRIAATVKGLSVDPGSLAVLMAARPAASPSRIDTTARISPLAGSVTRMSPPLDPVVSMASWSSSRAISCRSTSMVSETFPPGTGGFTGTARPGSSTPRASRSVISSPGWPVRIRS